MNELEKLFLEYRDCLGFGDLQSLEQQCRFEEALAELICREVGHDFGPDQCGRPEHDLCYRCLKLATVCGFRRCAGGYEQLVKAKVE